jgi:shikimate kinase
LRRVAVIASASGCGKTTFGRRLSEQLQVPFVELDELNHVGPTGSKRRPRSSVRR